MESPSTRDTKKMESFRSCSLSGMRIDKEELKKQLSTFATQCAIPIVASLATSTASTARMFPIRRLPSSSSSIHAAAVATVSLSRSEEQVFDRSNVKPHEFAWYGLSCLVMLAGLGDSCAKETRERIRVMDEGTIMKLNEEMRRNTQKKICPSKTCMAW